MLARTLLAVLALCASPVAQQTSAEPTETFGADTNPTGDPIGGGPGYSAILRRGDHIVRDASGLEHALRRARAGQTVFLPGEVTLDLTGKRSLTIPAGVALASDRGHGESAGALLFTTEDEKTDGKSKRFELFVTGGEGVRVTGLRLRGPDDQRRDRYDYLNSDGILGLHDELRVDNCELSGWSHGGVFARRGTGVHVHHCDIHHCQRKGLGYGVVLDVAEVLIEANRFDWCRHAIAGTGRPGSGYEARYNDVGTHANGHLFDMHGGRDRKDGTQVAGDWVRIHHNTFRCTDQYAFIIRGVPQQAATFHHNWFPHGDSIRAVRQLNARGRLTVARNLFGAR